MRTITLNGKDYPISFKMISLRLYKEITGCNLLKENVAKILSEDADPLKLSTFVYVAMVAGCYPSKPDFTLEDVESWLTLDYQVFNEVLLAFIDFANISDPNLQAPASTGA